jgi:hypothetical protein
MCKDVLIEKAEAKRFSMCKCDNKAILIRIKPQEYCTGGNDADAVLVHMKRTGCPKSCTPRSETLTMTLFQWQDMRQQFRTGEYLTEDDEKV